MREPIVRFMFNYLHCDIAKQVSATNVGDVGAKFDAFAVSTHIAFQPTARAYDAP